MFLFIFSFGEEYLNTIKTMSVLKSCTMVLNDLSKAAANARSEVEKLLTVLEGSAVLDVKSKSVDPGAAFSRFSGNSNSRPGAGFLTRLRTFYNQTENRTSIVTKVGFEAIVYISSQYIKYSVRISSSVSY